MIKTFKDFLNETKKNPETFSGYNGRYIFNVDKAYTLVDLKQINPIVKKYSPFFLNQYSREEFSFVDPDKMGKLRGNLDYAKPLGLLVKFKNPEDSESSGEWLLIDGNHRVRVAAEEGKSGDLIVIENPKDVDKFMKVNKKIPHEMFPDY